MSEKKFNLEDYETVAERLERFHKEYPTARVITDMVEYTDERVVFKAYLYKDYEDEKPTASGYAEETRGEGYVNKTAHLENCETSAIGRALANAGYAPTDKRPSREEMEKVARGENQEQKQNTDNNPSVSGKQAMFRLHQVLREQGHKDTDKAQIQLALALSKTTMAQLKPAQVDKWRGLIEKLGYEKVLADAEAKGKSFIAEEYQPSTEEMVN